MRGTLSRIFGLNEKQEELQVEITGEEELYIKDNIHFISIENIKPNPYQPRTVFDDQKIDELARTIEVHGMLQPIVVRHAVEENMFEIIAGERRYRASVKLGLLKVPVLIKEFSDKETAELALIENLQREELTPIEEAIAYQKLLELHEITQEVLAQQLGKGQSTVANKLRLLKLPQEVQQALLARKITERHARALIPLKELEKQLKLLEDIIHYQLNVKQTEDRVARLLNTKKEKPRPKFKGFSRDSRLALNTIRDSITLVNQSGLPIDTNEEEFEEYVQFTIRIPRK